MSFDLDERTIWAIVPQAPARRRERQREIIASVGPVLASTLAAFEINTPLRAAHFLAQVSHECAAFSTTEEFADGSAYEWRRDLGNSQPGDGRRYKGRGLIQLTGRFNYRKFGAVLDVPLEAQPLLAAEPVMSLRVACEYWRDRNLNAFADRDDITTITKRINGGLNGIDDRKHYLIKAKAVLGVIPQGSTVLMLGSSGAAVSDLQRRLGMPVTGEFDADTRDTVIRFQQSHALDADGIVGPKTLTKLPAA